MSSRNFAKQHDNILAKLFNLRPCIVCNKLHLLRRRKCTTWLSAKIQEVRLKIEGDSEWDESKWELIGLRGGPNESNDKLKRKIAATILRGYYVSGNYDKFESSKTSWSNLLSNIEILNSTDLEWQLYDRMCLAVELQAERSRSDIFSRLQSEGIKFDRILRNWSEGERSRINVKVNMRLSQAILPGLLGTFSLLGIMGVDPKLLSEQPVWLQVPLLSPFAAVALFLLYFEVGFSRFKILPSGVTYSSKFTDNEIAWDSIGKVEATGKLISMRIKNGSTFYRVVSKSDQRWLELVIKFLAAKMSCRFEDTVVEQLR